MNQDQLRELGDTDAIKNELVKEFTKHLEEPALPDDTLVKVKMVVLGPMKSGKTCWVNRVINDKFNPSEDSTVGAIYSSIDVAIDETQYQFEIWDVSGEEWCRSLCPMYLQHAHAAVICYDPSDTQSYQEAQEWVKYTKEQGDKDLIVAFVGTKHDLRTVAPLPVKDSDAEKFFVDSQNLERMFFFPHVSNKTGENAQDVILTIAEAFYDRGVRTHRGSVKDPDNEFNKIVEKGKDNKDILSPNDPNMENQDVKKCQSRFQKFTTSLGTGATSCFNGSKQKTKVAYETSVAASATAANTIKRNSLRLSAAVAGRSRRLIRRQNNEGPKTMQEVDTVATTPSPVSAKDGQDIANTGNKNEV